MPVYNYKGFNAAGKAVKGSMDSDGPRSVKEALKAKAIYVTEVWDGEKKQTGVGGREVDVGKMFVRVTTQDIAVMTRLLSTLLKAGIPLVEALSALVEQVEKEPFRNALDDIRQKVREGTAFNKALADHPDMFSDLYINMVRAGESSGNLDLVLKRLTEFLDAQIALKSKVTGAMVYPLIMGILGLLIVGFLFTFVIPKVTLLFQDQDKALPFITEVLIAVSSLFAAAWFIILPLVGVGAYLFFKWKKSEKGKPVWDKFILKVPLFGPLVRMIAIARFSRTLSTLLVSGVPLLSAMEIVKFILGNQTLIDVIEEAIISIREGESIAGPLKRSGQFPPIVTHMIAVGERAGQLEEMLDNVAESYNQQVNIKIQALTTLLEPLMIVAMGGAVAFIVFAIMLPILQLNEGII